MLETERARVKKRKSLERADIVECFVLELLRVETAC